MFDGQGTSRRKVSQAGRRGRKGGKGKAKSAKDLARAARAARAKRAAAAKERKSATMIAALFRGRKGRAAACDAVAASFDALAGPAVAGCPVAHGGGGASGGPDYATGAYLLRAYLFLAVRRPPNDGDAARRRALGIVLATADLFGPIVQQQEDGQPSKAALCERRMAHFVAL